MRTVLLALICYVAAGVFVVGLVIKCLGYYRADASLKMPTMPAPTTRLGVAWRLVKETLFFESLFKASKWTWLFGWLFHAALLVVLIGHLRFFVEPVWRWLWPFHSVAFLATLGMVLGLTGLWVRRILVERIRYITTGSDHLMLALLMGIALSGALMHGAAPTDLVAVKRFTLGLAGFRWQTLPGDPALLVHLAMVALLLVVFPFSKLLHAPGLFFSPTRNQADISRPEPGGPTRGG